MIARRSWLLCASLIGALQGVRAQMSPPRIGFLTGGAVPGQGQTPNPFEEGLRALGHVPGKTVILEYRAAHGNLELLPRYAAELVAMPVDVIVLSGPAGLRQATAATTRIPIVMIASSIDPVGEGIAASLARPGGNVTGLTYGAGPERFGKQLELLAQAAPRTRRLAVWWDTDLETYYRSWAAPLGQAAGYLSMTVLPPTQVLGRSAIDGAIESMKAGGADAILIVIGGPTFPYRTDVAVAAIRHRLPTVAAFKEFTRAGGLISYGPDLPALNRRGAEYVDRILKGATPGSLPIELPTRYELAVNTATARALGLTLPQALLLSADEVIA